LSPSIRFGDYVREIRLRHTQISYRHLAPPMARDAEGRDLPYRPPRLKLRGLDVYRLLQPYVGSRFGEQLRTVAPLAAYLVLFQWLVLRHPLEDAAVIGMGVFAVMLGLMLFLEGLKLGLMPFAELIGNGLPQKVSLPWVLAIAFVLGVGVTFAEPAVGALQAAGTVVNPREAPYLYGLLTRWAFGLVFAVGIGVGLAAVLGTLRFVYRWSLKPLIYLSLVPTLLLTAHLHFRPELASVVSLAWDLGAVTTGPVTVPLVLALGIGVAAAVGESDASVAGFGIVTLASIFPVLVVLLVAWGLHGLVPPEAVLQRLAPVISEAGEGLWYRNPFIQATLTGLRAIVPLVLFLILVLKLVLRRPLADARTVRYGIGLTIIGIVIFNLGLAYGLVELGDQSGRLIPGTFTGIAAMRESPLFPFGVGVGITVAFALVLGFGATMAEPALNAMGLTVESLTSGAFKKSALMYAVAGGVGAGIALGVVKIVLAIPLTYLLVPLYGLAVVLTTFSSEEYVNVAWDSAGVTTGPVTVPLVLAMGLGLGDATGAVEGFGILAAASLGPIIAVTALGLYLQWRARHAEPPPATAHLPEVLAS